jgi:SAM-dependent methyltransferase
MADPELEIQIKGATAYEDLFVPALFAEWAPVVVEAAQLQSGQRVLDVACGTGILARTAVSRVAPNGSVTGLDPNPGMLEVAARIAPRISWRQGTAESLPFGDQSFAAITTHHGVARFPSLRAMVEADLRGWLPLVGVDIPEEQVRRILAAADQELRAYVASDGRAVFDVSAHIVTATKR